MSSQGSQPDESEREQIQDDIERLQLALQEDDEYESESDDGNHLQIDPDYEPEYDDEPKPGPSRVAKYVEDEEGTHHEVQLGTADLAQLQMVEEDGDIVINPETCLALNRAYQEILLDLLRKIEIALQENRHKQTNLEEDLSERSTKRSVASSDPNCIIKPLTAFSIPFFKDKNGRHAPQNEDVRLKRNFGEIRQEVVPPLQWIRSQRELLIEAVMRESRECLIRPLMNKKEVQAERHFEADHGDEQKVKKEIRCDIDDLDMKIEEIQQYNIDELSNLVNPKEIDWMKISNVDFQGKRGSEDCRKFWQNVLHPNIYKDKWIPEEQQLLRELGVKHEMRNWDVIAKDLGTNRTAYQCLQFYQQNLNEAYTSRVWTDEEDELLKEVVENCKVANRISWNQVSYFLEGRNSEQCQGRWSRIDPEMRRGKWTDDEDFRLLSAVHLHGKSSWKLIKDMVPGRSSGQCRDRYNNSLDPSLKPAASWTYDEDKRMLVLVNKYTTGGTISWSKVATDMDGRTDNMVLQRYRRLMSWKTRADWLNQQDEETRKYLGAVMNKAQPAASCDTSLPLPQLGTFASGVQRDDYLRQMRDTQAGDMVVPRPPLHYKKSSKNLEQLWKRKLQLKKIVEHHINKSLNKGATPQDKAQFTDKTAKEFVPFTHMSKKQKIAMDNLFKENPCDVKVSDILNVTTKYKDRCEIDKNRGRTCKDLRIDRKMADIMQMRNYMSMVTRNTSGRPKKFYLFQLHGRKPMYDVPENIIQLTSVSTTLMMSALEVNGHRAVQNAKKKPESEMSESEKEDFTLLKKLFPPLPPAMKVPSLSVPKAVTSQGLKVVTMANVTPSTVTMANVTPSTVTMANVTPSTVTMENVTPSTVTMANVTLSTVTMANITSSTVTMTNVTPSTVTMTNVTPSTVTMANVTPSTVTMTNVTPSTVTMANATIANATPSTVTIGNTTPTTATMANATPTVALANATPSMMPKTTTATATMANTAPATVTMANTTLTTVTMANTTPATVTMANTTSKTVTVSNIAAVTPATGAKTMKFKFLIPATYGSTAVQSPSKASSGSQAVKTMTIVKKTYKSGKVAQSVITSPGPEPISFIRNKATVFGETIASNPQVSVAGAVQHSTVPSPASQTKRTVPSPASQTKTTIPSPASQTKPASVVQTAPSTSSGTMPTPSSSGLQQRTITKPRMVVVQNRGQPNPNNIPLLPPGLKNIEAFAGLLLQRKLLAAGAGSLYNEQYYQKVSTETIYAQHRTKKGEPNDEVKILRNLLDSFKIESRAAVLRGAKHVGIKSVKNENEPDSFMDQLKHVRNTPEYRLLQKRFEGLFTWPGLLSTIEPESQQPKLQAFSGKNLRREQRKALQESKPPGPESSIEVDELINAGEKGFALRVKILMDKKLQKTFPCAKSKNFFRRKPTGREWKDSIARKRLLNTQLNKEQREQGSPVKRRRRSVKDVPPTRQSVRIAQKVTEVPVEESDVLEMKRLMRKRAAPDYSMGVGQSVAESCGELLPVDDLLQIQNLENGIVSPVETRNPVESDRLGESSRVSADVLSQSNIQAVEVSGNSDPSVGRNEEINVQNIPITSVEETCAGASESEVHMDLTEDVTLLELKENSQGVFHADRISMLSAYKPYDQSGPSNAKKPKSELVVGVGSSDTWKDQDKMVQTGVQFTPLKLQSSPVHILQSTQPSRSVSSSSVAILQGLHSQEPPQSVVQSTTGQMPVDAQIMSNVATSFTHPGLEGHVLFAIPVDQLCRSTVEMNATQPNQDGVFPVTLLINTNTMTMSSPRSASLSQNNAVNTVLANQSVSSEATAMSSSVNENVENTSPPSHTGDSGTANETLAGVTSANQTSIL